MTLRIECENTAEAVETIKEHGPVYVPNVNSISMRKILHRRDRLDRLYVNRRARGSFKSRGNIKPIYYDKVRHDKEEILRAFFELNPKFVDGTVSGVTNSLPKEWRDVWRDIQDDYRDELTVVGGNGGKQEQKECPFCGEETRALAYHLPECDDAP